MPRAFPAALAVALTACGPALPDDGTAGGDGMSSGANDSVSASGGASDSGSGGPSSSGDSGDSQPDVDPTVLEMACIDALRNTLPCSGDNGDGWILQLCAERTAGTPAECQADFVEYWNCFATLTCEELDVLPSRCSEIEHAATADCVWGQCYTGGIGWPKGCEFTEFCDDVDHRITCVENHCTCFVDEQPVAQCDQGSICDSDPGAQQACCGFTIEY
jgi:hypothetical protein